MDANLDAQQIGGRRNSISTMYVQSYKAERIINDERIRGTPKVGEISVKVQERRLK